MRKMPPSAAPTRAVCIAWLQPAAVPCCQHSANLGAPQGDSFAGFTATGTVANSMWAGRVVCVLFSSIRTPAHEAQVRCEKLQDAEGRQVPEGREEGHDY